MSVIFNRTSVRKYENKEVEAEKIDKILRAAMAAPSAANQQPWEFYVVKNKETLAALADCSPYGGCIKDAAMAIVPVYRKEMMMPEFADIDMAACTENILLEVTELELGAVWIGIAPLADRMENVRKVLNVPDHLTPYAIIPIGYPVADTEQKDRFDAERVHFE
ncbi:nitroreductase family protein [Acetobacterium sp.]|jgi:nitroreductase|uniref:nitroreductase family protein n=1 Tax=Acetobacterium sp. TaxID=1872094 RepID=UPI0027276623|nr:nitroreductase family protein [Acetobacterium sp.]MDO9494000.1 nitroreductase family protein [Acetobacterium sp.]